MENANSSELLKAHSEDELSMCCESLCEKRYVYEYINYLENRIKELEEELHNGSN